MIDIEQGGAPRDFEGEARVQGWKPVEEFNGDPEKHKSAEQFVKDGEEKLSISNARVKHLTDALQSLQRKQTRAEKDFVAIREMMGGMEKRAYDRAMGDFKTQQMDAVRSGDTEAFEAIGERMEALRKDAEPEVKPKGQTKYEPQVIQRKYADFLADNDWFDEGATGGAKKAMTIYAGTIADELGSIDDFTGTPDEYFAEIADKVKERYVDRYPAMFGVVKEEDEDEPKPVKKKLAIDGVSAGRGGRNGVKSAAHLDQAAREQGQRFVNMGIFPNMDAYAKEYFANA